MYLESFTLPDLETEEDLLTEKAVINEGHPLGHVDVTYPCRLFSCKGLSHVSFRKITIFYGGNGSGKSTLLNVIAEKLNLKRIAPFNSGEMFDMYVDGCEYELGCDEDGDRYNIPNGSRIITSDDIFDYMLEAREINREKGEAREEEREAYSALKFSRTVRFTGLEDHEKLKEQLDARRKTRRQFVKSRVGDDVRLMSNGETALEYFETKLKSDRLYLLDEPENSMSPKLQLKLLETLDEMARFCGCQFVIATHSPFLLSLNGAYIYDLDSNPVRVKNWWELENTKTYFEFFKKHENLFL